MRSHSHQLELLSLLIDASRQGHNQAVVYLLDNGANPFLQDIDAFGGETALIAAARNGHADVVSICLLHSHCLGASKEGLLMKDNHGYSALQWAVRLHHVSVLSVLLHVDLTCFPQIESFAIEESTPSSILSLREFHSFINMHYPQYRTALLSQGNGKKLSKQQMGRSCTNSSNDKSHAQAVSFDEYVKRCFCDCSSWYRLENSMVVFAPYACFISLLIGFIYSVQFTRHAEMWNPYWAMIPLHFTNLAAQTTLWFLIYFTNGLDPGKCSPSSGYNKVLHKVLVTARSGVLEAAIASENGLMQRSRDGTIIRSSCCHVCRIWKDVHDGHSPITHRCIPMYDHYCVYLRQEIGRDNYLSFFVALGLMALVILPIFLFLSVIYVQHGLVPKSSILPTLGMFQHRFYDFFLVWTILSQFQMLLFFLYHVYCVSVGTTTREQSKIRKGPRGDASTAIVKLSVLENWKNRLWNYQSSTRMNGNEGHNV